MARKINRRERNAIIRSLAAGVVPRVGLQHIQVGRSNEVAALINDLKQVEEGAASIRFVVGRFGSGKTFFLNLIRTVALERRFVVIQADITTDRRLHGTGGKARSLYSELMRNLATRAKPEGGALPSLVERWVGDVVNDVQQAGGSDEDIKAEMDRRIKPIQELVSGYDFVRVLQRYYQGYAEHNEELQECALRWLRAEYTTKTEANRDLGVRSIIEDSSVYDYLKLMAGFVRIAGFNGLLINIDELVVLSHRLNSTQARNNNYEAILRILNDCLQGQCEGLAFLFAGTDECIEDRRRGLYSYEALSTRLAPNRFATEGLVDMSSPVIKLESLTAEDCYVLLNNIRSVFAFHDPDQHLLADDAIEAYLHDCHERLGAQHFQTPREITRDYVRMLNILEQNTGADWRQLLGQVQDQVKQEERTKDDGVPDDDLAGFTL